METLRKISFYLLAIFGSIMFISELMNSKQMRWSWVGFILGCILFLCSFIKNQKMGGIILILISLIILCLYIFNRQSSYHGFLVFAVYFIIGAAMLMNK
jgi:membrane-bound ClpP family serine protease